MSQPQQLPSYPPPPAEPIFQVRTVKHTGALVFWMNSRYTTTGTYARCDAAIDAAQQHCMLGGWWSFASILWNPISLAQNARARRTLQSQAQQAHDYALGWVTHYGGGPQRMPVWTPPPPQPALRKWWMWAPLAIVGAFVALIVLLHVTGATSGHDHHSDINQWAPTTTTPTTGT